MEAEVSFGRWLQRRRKALDLTQAELARAAACSSVMLRMIEGDERRPSKELAARLAEHLAIAPLAREVFVRGARGERLVAALGSPTRPATEVAAPAPLPAPLTTLVGRQQEIAAVGALLRQPGVRLVTLTGPGGVGKTRVALEVAAAERAAGDFAGGVWFVDLAGLRDPTLVVPTIARALAAPVSGGNQAVARLASAIGDRRLLLVLDNFEQVASAAPLLAHLLAATPRLRLLVTSRSVLRISGEYEAPVPTLALPDVTTPPTAAALAGVEAVALFVERARAAAPAFALTDDSAPAVAAICAQVDGLPLAIELAAAQVTVLPPAALRRRLDNRLGLLVSGLRDRPARHQTLRATLAWSHELLSPAERALLRRLAVFTGGFTLEAVERVGAGPDLPATAVLAGLTGLVQQSMVHVGHDWEGEPRYRLLEIVREYGLEQLAESGELAVVREEHAQTYLALAEAAECGLRGPEQRRWLARLDADHDNARAALAWSLDDAAGAALGLRLAGALARYWHSHGHHDEGRGWLERALAAGAPVDPRWRARALLWLGTLLLPGGDTARAGVPLTEALALFQAADDAPGAAATLHQLGVAARLRGEYESATHLLGEALVRFRALDDHHGMAWALHELAIATRNLGHAAATVRQLEEALALFRALGHERGVAWALRELGVTARHRTDLDRSAALLAESLPLMRGIGDAWGTARVLQDLAITVRYQGDLPRAAALLAEAQPTLERLGDRPSTARFYLELGVMATARQDYPQAASLLATSLNLLRETRDQRGMPGALDELARVALAIGQPARAAVLLGAATLLRERLGGPVPPVEQPARAATETQARAALGETVFAAAWAAGRAAPMAWTLAVDALDVIDALPEPAR
ncbi:MAG: helix-turn-helix domain-containing protein [Chloroflexi bacterium]|nr:helix-turn-helix domain-containing protein [Chloroflexota bacterium]